MSGPDFSTSTWRKLTAELQRRLDMLREKNDHPQPEEDTALIRGRIAEIRFILALPRYVERARVIPSQDMVFDA